MARATIRDGFEEADQICPTIEDRCNLGNDSSCRHGNQSTPFIEAKAERPAKAFESDL